MGSLARPDWTSEQLIQLKQLCDSGKHRFDKIATLCGRSHRAVMWKCYEQGFHNLYRRPPKYTYDKTYFDVLTYENCHWAGVLATDGCISWRGNRPNVIWGISAKDEDLMEYFKKATNSTHPLHKRWTRCALSIKDPEATHEARYITFENAVEWVAALERHFGITRDKSLRGSPKNLPSIHHELCYSRGLIDGDGVITASHQVGSMTIGLCGVNREIVSWFQKLVESMNLPSKTRGTRTSTIYQPPGENCCYYQVRGFRAAVLFEILRALPTYNLSRKWDNPRILEVVNYWKQRPELWPKPEFFDQFKIPSIISFPVPTPSEELAKVAIS